MNSGVMKRILFITDSLGFPHPETGLSYQDSYLSKLESVGNLWIMGGGGYTIRSNFERVLNVGAVFGGNFFDMGIIQLGIVDCAPRPIPYKVHKALSVCPKQVIKVAALILHNLRPLLLKVGFYQFTTIRPFADIFNELLKTVGRICSRTYIIGIAPISDSVERHSPGLSKQVAIYNDIIRRLSKENGACFIDISEFKADEGKYLTDDAHIKSPAHAVIWSRLTDLMKESNNEGTSV